MTLPTPYVDLVMDALEGLRSMLRSFDHRTWMLLSGVASTLDPRHRRTALTAAYDLAQDHARGRLFDHASQELRRATDCNPARAIIPDAEAVLREMDCSAAALVVSDLVSQQHLADLTRALQVAVTLGNAARRLV